MISASEARAIYEEASGDYQSVIDALEDIEFEIKTCSRNKARKYSCNIDKFTMDVDDGYGTWYKMLTKQGESLVKKLVEKGFSVKTQLKDSDSGKTIITIGW